MGSACNNSSLAKRAWRTIKENLGRTEDEWTTGKLFIGLVCPSCKGCARMNLGQLKLDFALSDETLKRCQIFELTPETSKRYRTINPELFHFLFEVETIDFSIYLRIDSLMIEFMKPSEFSKELVAYLWAAMEKAKRRLDIQISKDAVARFEQIIEKIRQNKVTRLLEKDPHLDRKTIEIFGNLSGASQLVVKGGINADVAERVQASAKYMVNNLYDSDAAIATLSRMVTHDPTLYDHSASVAMIAGVIARQVLVRSHALPKSEVEIIAQSGLYHDVGKTCVPSFILNKPGKFTEAEFEIMKSHTTLGEQELARTVEAGAPIHELCVRVAGEHHERFSGKGYPRGRKGREEEDEKNGIHLYTRIVTIADVYSALLMKRVYKPAYEPQDAVKIMAESAKDDYDPEIFVPFLKSVVTSLNDYQETVRKHDGGKGGRILFMKEDGSLEVVQGCQHDQKKNVAS